MCFGRGGSKVKVRRVTIMMDPVSNAHGDGLGVDVILAGSVS